MTDIYRRGLVLQNNDQRNLDTTCQGVSKYELDILIPMRLEEAEMTRHFTNM